MYIKKRAEMNLNLPFALQSGDPLHLGLIQIRRGPGSVDMAAPAHRRRRLGAPGRRRDHRRGRAAASPGLSGREGWWRRL